MKLGHMSSKIQEKKFCRVKLESFFLDALKTIF